jgi:hypothetical protein
VTNFDYLEKDKVFSRDDLEFITTIIAYERDSFDNDMIKDLGKAICGRMTTLSQ